MMNNPTQRKVYASTIGAGAGVTVSGFILWVADQIWWPSETVDVPIPVAAFIGLVVTTGLTFLTGWLAKQGEPPVA